MPVSAGTIDIQLRPVFQSVGLGNPVDIGIWVASNVPANQTLSAADIIFSWDTSYLLFNAIDNTGAEPLLSSALPATCPNEANPPADGDGYYSALAFLGTPVVVTPAGALLTTLKFTAIFPTTSTNVSVLPLSSGCSPDIQTVAYDGMIPNFDQTGSLGQAKVEITPEPASLVLLGLAGLAIIRRRRAS